MHNNVITDAYSCVIRTIDSFPFSIGQLFVYVHSVASKVTTIVSDASSLLAVSLEEKLQKSPVQ